MGQCKVEICIAKLNGRLKATKWGLRYSSSNIALGIYMGDRVLNKSGTAPLEFCSWPAAQRAHNRLCGHSEEQPQPQPPSKGEVCYRCGEDGEAEDPLTDWLDVSGASPEPIVRMAHAQCGQDILGWRMS